MSRKTVRKRKIDLDRARTRLYNIVLEGADKDAVAAARVLFREASIPATTAPNVDLLEDLRKAMIEEGL